MFPRSTSWPNATPNPSHVTLVSQAIPLHTLSSPYDLTASRPANVPSAISPGIPTSQVATGLAT